jgi:hypothetical protein
MFDQQFHAIMSKIPHPLSLGLHEDDWSWVVTVLLAIVYIFCIGLFYWRCVVVRNKKILGDKKRAEEKLAFHEDVVQDVVGRMTVVPSRVPEYTLWAPEAFVSWLQWVTAAVAKAYGGTVPHYPQPLASSFESLPLPLKIILLEADMRTSQRSLGDMVHFLREDEKVKLMRKKATKPKTSPASRFKAAHRSMGRYAAINQVVDDTQWDNVPKKRRHGSGGSDASSSSANPPPLFMGQR